MNFDIEPEQPKKEWPEQIKNHVTLTPDESTLLNQIMEDKYAVGPFCGMILNLHVEGKDSVEGLIKKALQVRLIAKRMAGMR